MFKSGDKLNVINYRHISLISSVAKVIEKVIKFKIADFLDKYNVMSENQYLFCKEGSRRMQYRN